MNDTTKLVLPNLNLAREITEKFLNDDNPVLNKDAFYMFSISKFILLKEKIIKKDSVNSILYFDNIKNKDYIPAILYFYKELLNNGSFKRNKTSVVLKDSSSNTEELENAIWCLNKIRDSLAHGKYFIDTNKDCISINNTAQDNSYSLVFDVPIELLNSFTFIVENRNDNFDKKAYNDYLINQYSDFQTYSDDDYLKRITSYIYNYYKYNDYLFKNDNTFIKKYKGMSSHVDYNYDDNKIYNYIKSDSNNIDSMLDDYKQFKRNINYIDRDKFINNYKKEIINIPKEDNINDLNINYILKEDLELLSFEELRRYAKILLMIRPTNKDEGLLYYRLLKEYKELLKQYKESKATEEFGRKTESLMKEMKKIIGIKDKQVKSNAIISLYNYMSIAFSQLEEIDYSKIKTESLFIDFTPKGEVEGTAVNYFNTINAINKKCEEFNNIMESHIINYDNNQNQRYRHSLMDSFVKFYVETMESFGRRNKFIIDSVRNSIEHANYKYHKSYIVLYDQTDHNDDNTIKFIAAARPEKMFEISKQIENSKNNEYLLSDFVKQLSSTLETEAFERTWNNMNKLSMIIFGKELDLNYSMENMYQEALLTVMKQAGLKQ